MKIENSHCVVTGASSGIGEALVRLLAERGARVSFCARRQDRIESLVHDLRAAGKTVLGRMVDVSDRAQVQEFLAEAQRTLGEVDVLVNNAGRGNLASVEETTPEQLASVFGVNVFALWHTTSAVLSAMIRRNHGHIITVSSVAGTMGFPFNSAYVSAKHAAMGFHASLRAELIDTNVQATAICPDGVMTEWASVTEGGPIGDLFGAGIARSRAIAAKRGLPLAPLARLLKAEDIAHAIADCIEDPTESDVYTHPGTKERAVELAQNRAAVEQKMFPLYKGMHDQYYGIDTE